MDHILRWFLGSIDHCVGFFKPRELDPLVLPLHRLVLSSLGTIGPALNASKAVPQAKAALLRTRLIPGIPFASRLESGGMLMLPAHQYCTVYHTAYAIWYPTGQ